MVSKIISLIAESISIYFHFISFDETKIGCKPIHSRARTIVRKYPVGMFVTSL